MKRDGTGGYGFGAFKGVFTPSILTIVGVVMYLRFGWVLGNLGLGRTLLLVALCNSVTLLTGLSLSALATNREVRGGGAYYLVSRAFGAEAGAAVGLPLFLSQAVSVAFYAAGFSEALIGAVPALAGLDPRLVGTATLVALGLLSVFSANLALKAQFFIMGAIALSLVSFFLGGAPADLPPAASLPAVEPKGFFVVLAVFFPAVTGILSGLGMSGDLRDPGRAIPRGTLAAVGTGFALYLAVPAALHLFVGDHPALVSDPMLFRKCARWPSLVLLGVWAACLSSALGSLLAAPRVLQALARDRLVPAFLGRGRGRGDDPLAAALLAFALALAGVWAGGVDVLAPVLTMVNLLVYALLNLAAALEESLGSPVWRPAFRVPAAVSAAGFALCLAMMFLVGPGAALAALLLALAIHWLMVRRRLRARWDDLRRSLLRGGARALLRRLDRLPEDVRNWQPDLLALGAASSRRAWLVDLAGALSRDRGLLTLASVVPEEGFSAERADEARATIRDWAEKRGVEAFAFVHPAPDPWTGMRELVRVRGFGPLAPNTVLLGAPAAAGAAAGAGSVAALAARLRRNVILAVGEDRDGAPPPPGPRAIDVWWRGRGGNAPFLLALACLLRRGRAWEGAAIRLRHVAEPGEDPARAAETLRAFLDGARVPADVSILPAPPAGAAAAAAIRAASAGADLALFGLRPPAEGESDEAYGAYLLSCRRAADGLPLALFALAAEGVDFAGAFA
ncbi:MAG: amino acid permease [Kiritimatiellae bacterium]|nr:amino acid permease [Kiritimatiellia bacterium]